MLTDVHYLGYRIVWDTRRQPGTFFWTGKAAVVLPADALGVKKIHRITGSEHYFSEEEAQGQLINEAKEWIDNVSNHALWRSHVIEGRRADL